MSAARNAAGPRRGRSVGALAAGFFATALLSLGTDVILHAAQIYPPWGMRMSDSLFVLATAYRALYTVFGGYLTARLAPREPMKHVWILAGVGTLLATVAAVATWNRADLGPNWYPLTLAVTALPTVWLGGRLSLPRLEFAQNSVAD